MYKMILKRWRGIVLFFTGVITIFIMQALNRYSSSDDFCASCHVHPHSTTTWKQSTHHDTKSGVVVHCVECHLPPGGVAYVTSKISTGLRDLYGTWFKNTDNINWEQKSSREYAVHHVYKASCLSCHSSLFPRTLSKEGDDAHLYYDQKKDEIRCINCHLDAGHYHEKPPEMLLVAKETISEVFTEPARVDSFVDYKETIPGSPVSFEMIAIPGGTFIIGSPPENAYAANDEQPQRKVEISPFWMGKFEVSWIEYEFYYRQNAVAGRTEDHLSQTVDAVTGPTPPYGNPGQGWGRNKRPAITMTFYAADHYCQWLSRVTGKRYRLPTEAEWEYACRAGSPNEDYFFAGSTDDYTRNSFINRLFGVDTTVINSYVIYAENSLGKTHPAMCVKPNPFGLVHMLGNVKEFCLDWYAEDIYATYPHTIKDPMGPPDGRERVIRGGSFHSDAVDVRIANRDHTQHDAWLLTDPQMPKSLWWYSDNNEVGFRVICEYVKK
jgi:sulfatase modifying factor 1